MVQICLLKSMMLQGLNKLASGEVGCNWEKLNYSLESDLGLKEVGIILSFFGGQRSEKVKEIQHDID